MTSTDTCRQTRCFKIFLLRSTALSAVLLLVGVAARAGGQLSGNAEGSIPSVSVPTMVITLQDAIKRAEANEPAYVALSSESKATGLDRFIARSALLPSVTYHNQAIYTEANRTATSGNSASSSPRFIANNAPREYMSQAVVNETLGLGRLASVRHADAVAARSAAELEISRRGLVATVTSLYYGVAAAEDRLKIAERALAEAADFSALTTKREQAREAAHADGIKAQLQQQQRERELSDARLAVEKARLELGVLLFTDPSMAYSIAAETKVVPLASRAEVEEAAARNNPELKSALSAVKMSNEDVATARASYLPDLGLNVTYGIDAPQFAVNGTGGARNLGYSASVTLDIPVWDWLSTQHRIKQSEIRRDAARVALSAAQSRQIARLNEAYSEAKVAREQLASLDESVATAAESLRLTKLRYTEGEATVLEVVDAQSAFVSIENAREDGRVRYETAHADLQTLTGTM